jgi:glycosyltransferase involved in cell wall biosynthesis
MTRVAVCVPAFDETQRLRELLASIARVEWPSVQVVVAVDGGNAATMRAADEGGAKVVAVVPNRGSYAARNAAVDAIEGDVDVVLFTDADCLVSPRWARAHVEALSSADLSGGGVEWLYSPRPTPAEWVDSQRHLRQQAYVEHDGYAATCNLAVRRAVLDVVRFDNGRRTGGDADFGRRARAAGFSLVYTPSATITHRARATRRDLLAKVDRLAGGIERERWAGRTPPSARLTRGPWVRAKAAGLRVGPVWGLRACLLDWEASVRIRRAVERVS